MVSGALLQSLEVHALTEVRAIQWLVRLLNQQTILARLFTADWLRPMNRMIEFHFYGWDTRGSNRSEPHRQVFEPSGDAIVSTFVCA
jgi:hypothetical protein